MVTPHQPEARLLVVDDEPNIRELLSASLRFSGFEVETAEDGRQALQHAQSYDPDLIVLDVMMPDIDGFAVATKLRERGNHVPVLFLTARDATGDKITGLTVGGDDYVTKPFSLDEVIARIRVILRRSGSLAEAADHLHIADLVLNEDAHTVQRAGMDIELSPTEFALLRYLIINKGRVVSKTQILDHVWQYDWAGDGAIVESYISYLRRKIDTPFDQPLIQTKRGVGYMVREP